MNKVIGFKFAGFLLLSVAITALHGQETDNTDRPPADFVFRIHVKPDNVPAEKIKQGDALSFELHEHFNKTREEKTFEVFANNHAEALKTVLKIYELFRSNATCVAGASREEENDGSLSFSFEYIPHPNNVIPDNERAERTSDMKRLELLCKEKSCEEVVKELDRLTSILNTSNGASIFHNIFNSQSKKG